VQAIPALVQVETGVWQEVVIGIDPGASGAITVLNAVTHEVVEIIDMPNYRIDSKGSAAHGKLRVSPNCLALRLKKYRGSRCCIEKVGSRPGNALGATFAFGQAFGVVLGVCAALDMYIHTVRPQDWIKHFGEEIVDGNDKKCHRLAAQARFGKVGEMFKRLRDDGRADSALIALYYINNASKYSDNLQCIQNELSW